MTSEELNALLEKKNISRDALGPAIELSLPTLRKKLKDPDTFTAREINAIGLLTSTPRLLARFLPK